MRAVPARLVPASAPLALGAGVDVPVENLGDAIRGTNGHGGVYAARATYRVSAYGFRRLAADGRHLVRIPDRPVTPALSRCVHAVFLSTMSATSTHQVWAA